MPIRYTDIDVRISGAKDFVIRKHKPDVPHLMFFFVVVSIAAASLMAGVEDKIALSLLLSILLIAAGWYVLLQIRRSQDLVLATEFQNALFASALGINNKFCLIIKRDGNIVYLDRSFQEMFPDFVNKPRRTIDTLLEYAKVPTEDRQKIFNAVEGGVYDKAIFNIKDTHGHFYRIIMSIEPILRPSGFILLRGREYVDERTSLKVPELGSIVLSKPTITLFSHVMDSMQMGIYMTAPDGSIVYANPLLEQWLDFGEDEIVSANLTLQDLISKRDKQAGVKEPTDYEGEMLLQKKTGGMLKVFVNQKILRDERKKVIGCAAMIHNIDAASIESEKITGDIGF